MKMKQEVGQTLIEALVALGIVLIVIVAIVTVVTIALSRSQFVKERTQAQKYAQEGIEWVRSERDRGWSNLANQVPAGQSQTYCFNTSPISSWPGAGTCSDFTLSSLFKRDVVLTRPEAPADIRITVKITVSWQEGGRTHASSQTTSLTKWK